MEFDWKRFSTLDRVIAAGAVVAFIALFLPWYGASIGPFSASVSGWSAGFSAWAGGLLLTAAGVLVVLRSSGANLGGARVGSAVLVTGIAALGLLLVIIRWLSFPTYHTSGASYDVGARYGIFIALIAGIAEVVAAVLALRASGEPMPWAQKEQPPEQTEPAPEAPSVPDE
ncbi:MAG TPA: hypothetical protein VH541_10075 [Gaiellaceae bacterium]|jgi:hypothetical protein